MASTSSAPSAPSASVSKCPICRNMMLYAEASVLQCGHTFHFNCIQEWVKYSKSCAICRSQTTVEQIVRRIFYEAADEQAGSEQKLAEQVGDLRTEMYSLEKRLEKAQENNDNLNTKCTKVMKKYETLRNNLLPKVNRLETENTLLRQVAQEREALSNENRLLLLQLRATEFYQFLMNTKDTDSEESLSQYIKSEEDLHCEKFLLLIKRQLVAAKKENHRFQLEIHEYEKRIAEFSKKEQKYKALVQDLRGEAKRCREQLDEAAKTPANPRLRSLLVDSIKRQHLGFDETRDSAAFEYDQQFLSTATKRPKISKLQVSGPRTFDDGEQIEQEENQREERVNGESVSAAPPIAFDDDAFELQPTTSHAELTLNIPSGAEVNVPKKMLQRVAAGWSHSMICRMND
ncbi:hypothetical protein WR25_14355 isoform B [Diploscapter pachys]|uniref:RING-type domain-containing protein n=1 Tax=Diploscapter pachys TaxID=2018661 RepID=A0A2A2J2Y3_9BILA|nr:hypothetical protein WR25_14355 isoform B [Diploscapter pachys]